MKRKRLKWWAAGSVLFLLAVYAMQSARSANDLQPNPLILVSPSSTEAAAGTWIHPFVKKALDIQKQTQQANRQDIAYLLQQLQSWISTPNLNVKPAQLEQRLIERLREDQNRLHAFEDLTAESWPSKSDPDSFWAVKSSITKLKGNEEDVGILMDAIALLQEFPQALHTALDYPTIGQALGWCNGHAITVHKMLLFYANAVGHVKCPCGRV